MPINNSIESPIFCPQAHSIIGYIPIGKSKATKVITFWMLDVDCLAAIFVLSGTVSVLYTASWNNRKYTNPLQKAATETTNNSVIFAFMIAGSNKPNGRMTNNIAKLYFAFNNVKIHSLRTINPSI